VTIDTKGTSTQAGSTHPRENTSEDAINNKKRKKRRFTTNACVSSFPRVLLLGLHTCCIRVAYVLHLLSRRRQEELVVGEEKGLVPWEEGRDLGEGYRKEKGREADEEGWLSSFPSRLVFSRSLSDRHGRGRSVPSFLPSACRSSSTGLMVCTAHLSFCFVVNLFSVVLVSFFVSPFFHAVTSSW